MTITNYRNFDLLITRSGDRYRAFVVDAPGGDANITFDLPFDPGDVGPLGALSEVHRGVSDKVGAGADTDLTTLGRQLFQAIFRDEVASVLAGSLTTVAQEKTGLRLRLRFEEDAADLAGLPWETLYDPALSHFIGLGEASPILRYLAMPRSRPALLVEPPLRVLAVLSSPAGLPSLDMDREWEVLQTSLADLVADGKFVVERLETPSLAALQNRLLGESVHILHFVGHGVFDETSQSGSLVLEDAQGNPQLVRGEQLATVLRNHPALRLIYLNACEGALASGQSVFTGVAQTLVREGVPAAVAMQAEISDIGAIELARTFYTALAAGRPVDAALTQARVALSVADSPEWAIPVLFSRSPDNRLFDIREVLPTPDCPYPGMVPFTEAQQDLFFGRDKEIGEAVDRLRQHPFLTVVGPSGSGKSSLIYAGVIPALRASRRFGPGQWAVKIMRPGQHPLAALAERLGCSSETLSSLALTERTLLFVDQFEETFTLAETEEAQTFLDALNTLIGHPNLTILLTVRADFYPDLMACSLWQPIRANRLELTPLGDDELWAAIVEPAARVGVTVDEALAVQLIADAAGQSGVLPLVQESLVLLWEKVERRQLRLAAYRQMAEGGRNGLQVAIDRRATVIYENLPDPAKPIARRIFLRLIQFGEGRADTRRQQSVDDLRASGDDPALFDRTLSTLTASRLLTTSGAEAGSQRRVDVSHEALIGGWKLLKGWIQGKQEAETVRRRLENKVTDWQRLGQGEGGLLDSVELVEAENWLKGEDAGALGYSSALEEYISSSHKYHQALLFAQAEAKRTSLEQQEALVRIRKQRIWIFGGAGLVIAAIVGIFFWLTYEPSTMPASTFNIAIAQLETVTSDDGANTLTTNSEIMERLANYISANPDSVSTFVKDGKYTVWVPKQTGGLTPETVAARAEEIGAHLIIYGRIESSGSDRWNVTPMYYVSDQAMAQTNDSGGTFNFGSPVVITGNPASVLRASEILEQRFQEVMSLFLGVGYLSLGDEDGYMRAEQTFTQAISQDFEHISTSDSLGTEMFYMFLGNAYVGQSEYASNEEKRQIALNKAVSAYENGLVVNPDFPRLYNSLGGALFQMASPFR